MEFCFSVTGTHVHTRGLSLNQNNNKFIGQIFVHKAHTGTLSQLWSSSHCTYIKGKKHTFGSVSIKIQNICIFTPTKCTKMCSLDWTVGGRPVGRNCSCIKWFRCSMICSMPAYVVRILTTGIYCPTCEQGDALQYHSKVGL